MLTDVWFWVSFLAVSVAVGCLVGPLLHHLVEWCDEYRRDDVDELLERERTGRASW